ncbi:hypothetical protein SCALM49S_01243 [Streptomyces californicus]
MSEADSSVSGDCVKHDTHQGHFAENRVHQLPHLARTSAARRSTPVARMEYCDEPWGGLRRGIPQPPEGADGGTRTGGFKASHGCLLHKVTKSGTLGRNGQPCHGGGPGRAPDTPGNLARL